MRRTSLTISGLLLLLTVPALPQSLRLQPPAKVTAGESFTIASSGSGTATFYLLGSSHVAKRTIHLGEDVLVPGSEVSDSGLYQAVACVASDCSAARFVVAPSSPARLGFLVHPSRAPVSTSNVINATVLVFDQFNNTLLAPTDVDLRFSPPGAASYDRNAATHRGIAWLEIGSTPKQGQFQIVASAGSVTEPRIVQQVASEACGLRLNGTHNGRFVRVQTEPVRDCSGNPLSDGTIVTFTKIDSEGRSTVDAPIKKGVATAQFELSGQARISVACGVVLGNELSIGGRP